MHIFYVTHRPKKVNFCELVVVLLLHLSYNDTVDRYFTKYKLRNSRSAGIS